MQSERDEVQRLYDEAMAQGLTEMAYKWKTVLEEMDDEIIEMIAKYVTNNVRELKWILLSILSMKKLCGSELTTQFVDDYLTNAGYITDHNGSNIQNIVAHNERWVESFSTIVEFVWNYYDISVGDIKSDSRKKDIAIARQMLMLIARDNFDWTLKKIWDYFGGKDHASVIYALDTIKKKLKTDKNLAHDYTVFIERVNK